MPQVTLQQAMELALEHHRAGRLDEAEAIYRQVLSRQPNHADALHLLGMVAWNRGQLAAAQQLITRAIQFLPNSGVLYANLGMLLLAQNQVEPAISYLQKAVQLSPDLSNAHFNLGLAYAKGLRFAEAAEAYSNAARVDPEYADAWNNLSNARDMLGDFDGAIAAFERAIAVKPDAAEFHSNLADVLARHGRPDESVAAARRALALRPDLAEAANHLGNALREQGLCNQAIEAYRTALRAKPDDAVIHSNLIYAMHFSPSCSAADIADELAQWRARHAQNIAPMTSRQSIAPIGNRRLRIGYVSPDFRDHCQSLFTLPLLEHHDKSRFEIYCYADMPCPDAISHRIRNTVDSWRNIAGLSDQAAAELILKDRIDILVDLTLHMSRNRMLVFARKPAPIQATWLGYPGSTGLATVDYRITDRHLDPPGVNDAYYSEQSLYLPDSFWCFDPLDPEPIDQPAPPSFCDPDAPITFGCLNSFVKVNLPVLSLWAKVLLAVPDSRMLILTGPGSHRQRTLDELAQFGVDPSRIEFLARRSRPAYLELFDQIDISLDTFPANGHTTTMDSLWMGVPVVTLPGPTAISRGAMSILKTIGLPQLVAESEEDYVHIASNLARDSEQLLILHSTLRERMRASPIMDAPRFARNMEGLYLQMIQDDRGQQS